MLSGVIFNCSSDIAPFKYVYNSKGIPLNIYPNSIFSLAHHESFISALNKTIHLSDCDYSDAVSQTDIIPSKSFTLNIKCNKEISKLKWPLRKCYFCCSFVSCLLLISIPTQENLAYLK